MIIFKVQILIVITIYGEPLSFLAELRFCTQDIYSLLSFYVFRMVAQILALLIYAVFFILSGLSATFCS